MIKLKEKVNKSQIMRDLHNEAVEIYKNSYEAEYCIEQFLYGAEKLFEKLRQSNVVRQSEQLKCDHEWKFESFDQFGFPIEKYCENCGDVEAL